MTPTLAQDRWSQRLPPLWFKDQLPLPPHVQLQEPLPPSDPLIVMLMPLPPLVMAQVDRLKIFRLLKPRSWLAPPSPMRTTRLGLLCKLHKQHRTASRGKGELLKKQPSSELLCAKKRGMLWMRPVRLCHRRSKLNKPQGLKPKTLYKHCTRLPRRQCPRRNTPNKLSEPKQKMH